MATAPGPKPRTRRAKPRASRLGSGADAPPRSCRSPRPTDADELTDPRRSDVDEWGRSEHMREIARQVYGPMYRSWHRVEWEGLEKIPTDGGALLVSNHAGADPGRRAGDHARHRGGARPARVRPGRRDLQDDAGRRHDVVARRRRARPPRQRLPAPARAEAARPRVPRGHQGHRQDSTASATSCARFGRGGFVQIAMRAGVPVVPIAVVGAEEAMPTLFKINPLAKALGVPVRADHRQHARLRAARRCCRSPPRSRSACSTRCPSTWSPISPATRGA